MAPVSLLTPAQCLGITANRCGEFYIVGWMSPVGGGLTQRWLGREGKEKISHVKAREKGRIWQCEKWNTCRVTKTAKIHSWSVESGFTPSPLWQNRDTSTAKLIPSLPGQKAHVPFPPPIKGGTGTILLHKAVSYSLQTSYLSSPPLVGLGLVRIFFRSFTAFLLEESHFSKWAENNVKFPSLSILGIFSCEVILRENNYFSFPDKPSSFNHLVPTGR